MSDILENNNFTIESCNNNELLNIKNLKVKIKDGKKDKGSEIVKGVDLSICNEETLGIVGESGCGKSVAVMSILKLLGKNIEISEGEIVFEGRNLVEMSTSDLRKIAGKDIGMIFQEPMKYLNPLMTVERQLSEPIKIHTSMDKKQIHGRCIELLEAVGINDPERTMKNLPHELSGGMRQRILIAMAISCNPKLLIADEPTTALDVTVQAQILNIIKNLVKDNHMSLIIISHDLGVISEVVEKIAVMYAGEIVEVGSTEDIFDNPMHPYTKQLLISAKEINQNIKVLSVLEGSVPKIDENVMGCRFCNRCKYAIEKCNMTHPDIIRKDDSSRLVRCHLYEEVK